MGSSVNSQFGQLSKMRRTSEGLGKDVSKLQLSRDITERNEAIQQLFTNKMTIQFNVLGPLMENRILGNVDGSLVITLDRDRSDVINGELMKQPAKPCQFSNQSAETPIFCFSRREGNSTLLLGLPRDQTVTKEDDIATD